MGALMIDRRALMGGIAGTCITATLGGAGADAWPAKPIHAIVPFGAGSAADIIPRAVFEPLSARLGQPIVVENRPGAGGTLGVAAVAKAEPDGYTLLAHSAAHTIAPYVVANVPYDPAADFVAVTTLANLPNVLVVSLSRNIRTVQEFIAMVRKEKRPMNYSSGGIATPTHLNSERFRLTIGFEAQHIPFKGSPEAVTEVMADRVDFYFGPLLPAIPLIEDKRLVALAVSGPKRVSVLPDVPTTTEAGLVNADYNFWIGVFAPAKTPREIVTRLYEATAETLKDQAVKDKLAKLGAEAMTMRPEAFDGFVRAELVSAAALAKAVGLAAR